VDTERCSFYWLNDGHEGGKEGQKIAKKTCLENSKKYGDGMRVSNPYRTLPGEKGGQTCIEV